MIHRTIYSFLLVYLYLMQNCFAQESRDSLIANLGETTLTSYINPLTQNFGNAYNMGWVSQMPSQENLDVHVEFSFISGISYVNGAQKKFNSPSIISLDKELAEDFIENVDYSQIVDPVLKQKIHDALIYSLLNKKDGFQVQIYGPTIVGSSNEKIKIIKEKDKIAIEFNYYDTAQIRSHLNSSNSDTSLKYSILYKDSSNLPTRNYIDTVSWQKDTITTSVSGILEDLFSDLPDALAGSPSLTPQISIGSFYGTQMALRYTPTIQLPKLGKVSYYGWSIQHDLLHFLPIPSWYLLAHYSYQEIDLLNIMKINTQQFGFTMAKELKPIKIFGITPYFGWNFDQSQFSLNLSNAIDLYKKISNKNQNLQTSVQNQKVIEYHSSWEIQSKLGFKINIFKFFDFHIEYTTGSSSSIMANIGLEI